MYDVVILDGYAINCANKIAIQQPCYFIITEYVVFKKWKKYNLRINNSVYFGLKSFCRNIFSCDNFCIIMIMQLCKRQLQFRIN